MKFQNTTLYLFICLLVLTGTKFPAAAGNQEFPQVRDTIQLNFPADHASHPTYKIEWWYFTGEFSSGGDKYGYQFTIFRRRVSTGLVNQTVPLATDQILTAHLALTDVNDKKHYMGSFASRSWGSQNRADTMVPGQIAVRSAKLKLGETWTISAKTKNFEFDFRLQPTRAPLLHGQNGYSAKGPKPGQATMYYSQTRMKTRGRLKIDGRTDSVQGTTWFDHEYGSSHFTGDQVGWDWLSLRLNDGRDLMIYRIREKSGTISDQSAATIRYPDSGSITIDQNKWSFQPVKSKQKWISPVSDAKYPLYWNLTIPQHNIDLTIKPVIKNQEMVIESGLTPSYWEGLVTGQTSNGEKIASGYMELTGYDAKISGFF
jgi:predicted secreted hydrolase